MRVCERRAYMKRKMRRGIMLALAVLTVAVLFVCLSAVVYAGATDGMAARIGVDCYETLSEAVTAANEGDTVKLLTNVTLSGPLTFTKSMRIDLNGKKLTGPSGADKYIFSIAAANIDVKVIGEGSIHTYENVISTQEGMIKFPEAYASSSFAIAGSFDGITLTSEGGAYVASTYGNITLSNIKAYAPKDGARTSYGYFNARTEVKLTLDRIVTSKYDGPSSTNVPANTDAVLHVYDCATVTVTNCYFEGPKRGIVIRHDGSPGTAVEGRKYLTVKNTTVKATHARYSADGSIGWSGIYSDDAKTNQIGWQLDACKGFAVACYISTSGGSTPVGEVLFDNCLMVGAWRVFVQDAAVVPIEELKHKVTVTNSELKADVSACGVLLTQSLVDSLISARKKLDGSKASSYTYTTEGVGYYIIPSEIAIVRGRGARFYFSNCDMFGYGGSAFLWTSDDKNNIGEASDASEYFFLDDDVRFNRVPGKFNNFTCTQYGAQDNYIVAAVHDDPVYKYGIVHSYDGLWGSNDGSVATYMKYNYYGTNGTTVVTDDYGTNAGSMGPVKVTYLSSTDSSPSFDGSYMKLTAQMPSNNTYYNTSGKPGYVDADTVQVRTNPYFLVYGKSTNSGDKRNEKLQLYDPNGKALFKYAAFEVHFKTDSTFMTSNTNFSLRAVDDSNTYADHHAMMYFYESGGTAYLRTYTQNANNVTDTSKMVKLSKAKGQWYRYTCVIELEDLLDTSSWNSKAYFYVDGKHVGTEENALAPGLTGINGFRFNFTSASVLDVGETICFDSYSVRTSNQAYINLVNILGLSTRERSSDLDEIRTTSPADVAVNNKYFSAAGTTSGESVNSTQKLSPTKLTDGGDHLLFTVQNPTDSNTSFGNLHSTDGGKTVTVPSGLDSFILMRGVNSSGSNANLTLYNSAGTVPAYDKVIFEVDIKTNSNFIESGSNLSFRLLTDGGAMAHYVTLYFVEDIDPEYDTLKTFVRTHSQYHDRDDEHPVGQGGIALATNTAWQRITIVVTFNGSYKNAYADFYVVGKHIGRQDKYVASDGTTYDLFRTVPHTYDALRFNIQTGGTYGVGDNIAFKDYTLHTYKNTQAYATNRSNLTETLRTSKLDTISSSNPANVGGGTRYIDASGNVQFINAAYNAANQNSTDAAVQEIISRMPFWVSDEGDYLKWQVRDPDGGSTVSLASGQSSYLTIKGTYPNDATKTGYIPLYNSSGAFPKYDVMTFEVDIKTESSFITQGSMLTLRLEDVNNDGSAHGNAGVFFVDVGGTTYVRTRAQHDAGSGGVALTSSLADSDGWYRFKIILCMNSAHTSMYAHFYVGSTYVGGQKCSFNSVIPVNYDALRFNVPASKTFDVGDNICFKNYKITGYKNKVSGSAWYYGHTFIYPVADPDYSSSGVYANYINTADGKLYGTYYDNVTAALAANPDTYPTLDLLKSESGTSITAPVRIKETGSATFTNFKVPKTMGYLDADPIYTFSDTYHSLVGLNEYVTYGSYVSYPTQLFWNQPIEVAWRNNPVPAADAEDDTLYSPVAWSNTKGVHLAHGAAISSAAGYTALGPIEDKELYAVYKTVIYIVWKNGTAVTKYSVEGTEFVDDFNALSDGGKIQLREDVIFEGNTQLPIINKTLTLDLYGERLTFLRPSEDEGTKKIFWFANETAADASTLNVLSTIDGGEIFAGIKNSQSCGAIFYMGTDGYDGGGNVVNIGGGNVGLFSSCIADIRGNNNVFNATEGGRFIKSGSDYSGLFVARPGFEGISFNIADADIGSIYRGGLFNLLCAGSVVNLTDCNVLRLGNTECVYLVARGSQLHGSTTYTFCGTVNCSGVRSNIPLTSLGEDDPTYTSTGRINLNGNNYTSLVRTASYSDTGAVTYEDKTTYFFDHECVSYNGLTFTEANAAARFGRVDEVIELRCGDDMLLVPYVNATAGALTMTCTVDDVLEVVTLEESEISVRWVNYNGTSRLNPSINDKAVIETGHGSPYSIEAVNEDGTLVVESVYYYVWKLTGEEVVEPLSFATPRYPINLDTTIKVCEMKTKSDFSLMSNLTLTDNFNYNIYVPASLVANGGSITYTAGGKTYNPTMKPEHLTDGTVRYTLYEINGTSFYRIQLDEITVFNANDTVSFTMSIPVIAPGAVQQTHNPKWTYSVPKYATKVLNNPNDHATAKQMASDMLSYVSAAYLFDGKATPTEVTAAIELARSLGYPPSTYAPEAIAKAPSGIGSYITGVQVNIAVPETRYRFTFANGLTAMVRLSYFSAKGHYNEAFLEVRDGVLKSVNSVAVSGDKDYFELSTKVYDFNADIVLAVDGDGDGMTYDENKDHITEFNSLSYVAYIEKLISEGDNSAATQNALALMKRLYCYSESARKYQNYIMGKA